MDLYNSPIRGFNDKIVTQEQRVRYCKLLEQEYRGDRILIDDENIDIKYRSLVNTAKIKSSAIYVPIVKPLIDEENNNYDNGVLRQFVLKNGKLPNKKVTQYLTDLYEQSQYSLQAIQWEHEAALFGTLMIRPVFDDRTGLLHWIRLIPSDDTLKVLEDAKFPNVAAEITYITGQGDKKLQHVWDWLKYRVYEVDKSNSKRINVEPIVDEDHGFKETSISEGGMPWATLRYTIDSRVFWGPFDGGLASLSMLRSFLLADSVHRTQASMYEILVMSGYKPEEAVKSIQTMMSGKVILAEKQKKNDSGEPYDQDVKYISPQGMEPAKVLDHYMRIYEYVRQVRGHARKNFEVGAKVQSFEAQRLAEGVLRRKQLQNRPFLWEMEQKNLKLLVHENNKIPGNPTLPEDLEVVLDWVDPTRFANMQEFSNFALTAVTKNWLTDVQVIKILNPDLTEEQALKKYEDNKEFNDANVTKAPIEVGDTEDSEDNEEE